MNDRHLFKAKRIDTGEWVEGSLRIDPDLDTAYINGWEYYSSPEGMQREPFEHQVYNFTICQCTGLKDKNGRLIWENDIVSNSNIFMTGKVIWVNIKWMIDDVDDGYQDYDGFWGEVKIIGNIFDSPELLEV